MNRKKKIAILGSTGSIGVQTLNVISNNPEMFDILCLTANNNLPLLSEQIAEFKPRKVVIANKASYDDFVRHYNYDCEITYGEEALVEIAANNENDLVVSALVGFSGVMPTLAALRAGTDVALANKETLVAAGEIMVNLAKKTGAKIIAIDSEHNAILQCLAGENYADIEKIILTSSGGPFRKRNLDEYDSITISEALNHPNWSMGSKITIDSATMMNKGFEVIEAHWLFDISPAQIEVVIHPQSIIHSFVQFKDASIKAQMGLPDMRVPISYAIHYPNRVANKFPRLDFMSLTGLDFWQPTRERYPCLYLAYESLRIGKNSPAALNAANEVCVSSFLKDEIKFTDIARVIESILETTEIITNPTLEDIEITDKMSRRKASEFINNLKR
ncbi:MAG: 1-deoxy-D-xylulose-5-phosphate reductoisomerase [Ignavibacteriae bacterium HGW-Ignavibacteriae-1]|jgi:1-deoxy-D-xylulose-5-phosphate reductoisomerase|nr:MAG: 1-deoxy-D-xylulose-5-phosphate reductoisomerase [Ignavibacteriae bacterium HGW-Ignavibacteriae-1]